MNGMFWASLLLLCHGARLALDDRELSSYSGAVVRGAGTLMS